MLLPSAPAAAAVADVEAGWPASTVGVLSRGRVSEYTLDTAERDCAKLQFLLKGFNVVADGRSQSLDDGCEHRGNIH